MRILLFGFAGICAVMAAVTVYQLAVPAELAPPLPDQSRAREEAVSDQSRAHEEAVSDQSRAHEEAVSDQVLERRETVRSAELKKPLHDGSGSARKDDAAKVISTPVRWAAEAESQARTPLQLAIDQTDAYRHSRAALDAAIRIARGQAAGDEVLRLLAIGVERFPYEPELRFDYGVEFMKLRLWSQAIPQLQRVAADAPEHPMAWHNLAVAQQAAGNLSDAERSWTRAIELAPSNSDAYAYRGQIRLDLHEWSRALADFEHVLETEPGAIDAYLEAATALSQLERYSEALARAQQGVDLAPDTTAVLNQAARIAIEACVLGGASGKTACDAAQRFADRSLKIDGNQPEIIALRADACVVRE